MNAFGRSRRHQQIARSLQDAARSERLPELHIEVPSGRAAADQAFHNDVVSHRIRYSSRKAAIGSSRAARRAGTYAATAVAAARISTAPANCTGSLGRTPNNRLVTRRPAASDAAR